MDSENEPIGKELTIVKRYGSNSLFSEVNQPPPDEEILKKFKLIDIEGPFGFKAENSYGEIFKIGDVARRVGQGHPSIGATITALAGDKKNNEVICMTSCGWIHIDFITKETEK